MKTGALPREWIDLGIFTAAAFLLYQFGALFFLLVVLAALGSAVAIMEPAVGSLVQMTRLRRPLAVLLVGGIIWLLGLAVALSLAGEGPGDWYGAGSLLSLLDTLTADCLLPLVALLTALLVSVIYYVMQMVSVILAKNGLLPPLAGAGLAFVLFLAVGAVALRTART